MGPKELKSILTREINAEEKDKTPLHLWGPPGIGKSAIVKEVALEEKIGLADIRLSQKDPTDLRGIPIPDLENRKAVWLVPDELPTEGKGILFLDELNLAPLLVQASAYQLIFDRSLGQYKLPEGWTIIAAGNKPEHVRGGARDLPLPLRNRFIHVDCDTNYDDWSYWAVRSDINTMIVGFLAFRPELLMKFNPETKDYAFPTPRTWEFVSKKVRLYGFEDTSLRELVQGAIGSGASSEFFDFIRLRDKLPNLNDILEGQDIIPEKEERGLLYALISGLAEKAEAKYYNRLLQYSFKLPKEFAVLLVTMLVGKDSAAVYKCKLRSKWVVEFRDVIL